MGVYSNYFYNKRKMDPLTSKFQVQQMRELPHNLEAEQSLLGAIMLDNECYEDVADIISPDHFLFR